MTSKRKKTILSLIVNMMLITAALLVFGSCAKDDDDPEIPIERVLLVYMAGDNNLSSETYQKIEEIRKGWNGDARHRLLVYTDPADAAPSLNEIVRENSNNTLQKLSVYEEENSASGEVFSRVIRDMMRMYPAPSYGLLVFSHASGWLPEGALTKPKSLLIDGTDEMALTDFGTAIPNNTFDYIVFETCFSAGIEAAYQLKDKTKYILASSAEIVSPGFTPIYNNAINLLFEKEKPAEKFGRATYTYFNQQSGYMRSATFSVIDTKGLDNLAKYIKENCDFEKEFILTDIQKFDRYSYRLFFDFGDYYSRLLETEEERQELNRLIEKCVVWKVSTPLFMQGYNGFEIKEYSGMTSYIPQQRFPLLDTAYRRTQWSKDIHPGRD